MKKLISALSSLCLAATSLLGAFPAVRAENAVTAQAADSLVYNLVPNGKTYDSAEEKGTKNNVYKAEAGESLKIDWTVKGDPGTAGIQMNFDFTQVTYESASRGSAYRIVPTYSDYKSTTNLKQGECIYTWAQSEENQADDGKVIYSFNVTVPSAEGTYSVGLKSGEENKVVPIDQTKTIPFTFHGLEIVVGNGGGGSPQPSGDGLIYNLIPNGKSFDSAEAKGTKNNVYKAEAGETLKIDWTVKGDPGTAGIQMNFDFTQVTYESASRGSAYRIVPTYSDYKSTTNLKQGECIYTWAQSEENQADDGKVIYSFNVTVPSAEGTYTVGLKSGEENKVVPIDQTKTIPFTFHGLDIVVGSGGGNPQPSSGNGLIYNLIPNGKTYDSAETKGTKNNVYKAEAGESLKIDWTVKGDPGTAGIQMNFDFTQVTYESASRGSAYRIVPTYSDYKTTTNLKQGECIYTWAQSEENEADDGKVIYSFNVTVPSAEGTYTVGLKSGEENKVVPIDQTKTIPFTFHGLDIVVGSGGGNPQPSGGDGLIYNLIPNGKTYDSAETKGTKNNVYKAEAGESLKIDWTVKGDPGTAGIQMNFDFTQVTYESASRGNAYRIVPTYSDYKTTTNLKQGECIYTWAQSEENEADDGKVIYSFNVTVPSTEGTYTVGLKSGEENKVVPIDQTKTIPFTFHGLDIVVGSGGNPQPSGGDGLIYNLIPNGKTYDSAETKGTKNNVYKAEAGETLKIDWTVKGDPGTAGIQMNFDFTQVSYTGGSRGSAYRIVPTYSDYNSTEKLLRGQAVYTWAQSEENQANDGAVIYSFNVTVPNEKGTYSVGLNTAEENKVVPLDQNKPYDFTFYGLDIVVGDSGPQNPPPSGSLVYNLVPNGKSFDSAEAKGTKNNVYKAEAGESLKIDWTVKGDPGTAGIQMNFDFTQVTYESASRGSAYRIVPTYSDYKSTTNLKQGECIYTWAQSEENEADDGKVIYSFNVKVPNEKGTYTVGLKSGEENKVVPIDQTKTIPFTFYGLDIVVGDSGSQDPPPAGSLIYNLVPNGKTYDSAETKGTKNNVYKAEAGESLKIDWTVKGDPGTAGIQMNFDFTQVTYESASRGNAYRIVPTYSDYKTTTNLKQGECIYTWAQSEENEADDGKVIYSFNVKVPNEKGTYTVGLKSGEENKVVPIDQTKTIPFTFYGLDIVVDGSTPVATTQPPVTTEQPPVTTTTKPEPIGGSADWMIGQKEVAPGGYVKIPVLVYNDEGTAGFVLKLDMDSSLKIDSIDWTGAYSGEPTLNPEQRAIVWASTNGSDQSADGAILYLNITAPEADGNYPIRFEKLDVTNTVGAKVDAKTKDGGIKVDRSILDAGTVNWEIGQAAVKPGDTAKVPVKVSGDSGTAGFTVRFEHDPELKFTGFEFGDGYSGEAQMNDNKLTVVWANSDGSNEKADGDIIYLKFTAPDKEGEYPVGVSFIDVSNTLGQNLKVNVTSGSVKADPKIGTGDTPSGLRVVKSYDISFTPPTRKNYWSHDTRTLKNCGGLEGMRAEMTVYKAYVNDKNELTDVKGEPMKNANGQPVIYEDGMDVKAQAFETRTKDITEFVDLSDPSVTAKMIWDGQADSVTKVENHKYRISLFYDAAKQTDEDFKVSDSKIKLGDHTIFIGVKGDYNLDDVVSVDDAQNTLKFYTEYYVANKKNTKLSENPEYDGLNGLVFYLINVRFLTGDSPSDPMEDPQQVSADDAQCILRYYTDKDVAHKQGITWEKEVGYDLLDSFYQK